MRLSLRRIISSGKYVPSHRHQCKSGDGHHARVRPAEHALVTTSVAILGKRALIYMRKLLFLLLSSATCGAFAQTATTVPGPASNDALLTSTSPQSSAGPVSAPNLTVSVLAYGAKVDGTTDDTTAWQNAINAVSAAGGGVVQMPKGTSRTGQLSVPSFVTLKGTGYQSSTLMLANGANAHMIVLSDPVNTQRVGIEALLIDGNKANQSAATYDCVRLDNTGTTGDRHHYINNLYIQNCSEDGISMPAGRGETRIQNLFIDHTGRYGLYLNTPDVYISNTVTARSGSQGMYFASGASNAHVENTKSWFNGQVNCTQGDGYYFASGSNRNVLIGLEAQDNEQNGFVLSFSTTIAAGLHANGNGRGSQASQASCTTGSGFVLSNMTSSLVDMTATDFLESGGNVVLTQLYGVQFLSGVANNVIHFDSSNNLIASFTGSFAGNSVTSNQDTFANNVTAVGNTLETGPVTISPSAAATSGSNHNSPNFNVSADWWDGSVSQAANWTIFHQIGGPGRPTLDNLIYTPPIITGLNSYNFVLGNLQVSTSSSGNFNSVAMLLQGAYWNGSGSSFPSWSLQNVVGTGTAPTSDLILQGPNSGGSIKTFQLDQSSTATIAHNYPAPAFILNGSLWTGSAAVNDAWSFMDTPGAGANPTSTLVVSHSGGTGAAVLQTPTILASSLKTTQLAAPSSAPTIGKGGIAGSTSYFYVCTAVDAAGGETAVSAAGSTTTGNATLSGTNYNAILCNGAPANAVGLNIYRTSGGATQGLIFASIAAGSTQNDIGSTATTLTPLVNGSGAASIGSIRGLASALPISNAFVHVNDGASSATAIGLNNGRGEIGYDPTVPATVVGGGFSKGVELRAGMSIDSPSSGTLGLGITQVGTPYYLLGTAIPAAATIAPTGGSVFHITTSSTSIGTITPPTGCTTATKICSLTFIMDTAAPFITGGNILVALTTTAGQVVNGWYDPGTVKWYLK
jgi:hypothetical protein